jgi:hypothetical protein
MFLCHGPLFLFFFLLEHLLCVSHRKTYWTMSVDNVGLQIRLFGTSNSMVTLTIFSLVYTEVVSGEVQQPIAKFTRPWTTSWSMM